MGPASASVPWRKFPLIPAQSSTCTCRIGSQCHYFMYGPGTFQTAASALVHGVSESMCRPFKSNSLFLLALWFFLT